MRSGRSLAASGLAVLAALVTGCAGAKPAAGPVSTSLSAAPLPPGDLAGYVPQPAEVPAGLVLVRTQSGPATPTKLASFAGSSHAAVQHRLLADGFSSAYIAEYASPSGRSLTTVVTRFTSTAGAHADLVADSTGQQSVPGIGAEDAEQVQPLPGSGTGGQLVTERFRVNALTFLLAAGATRGVDTEAVRTIAGQLAQRAGRG